MSQSRKTTEEVKSLVCMGLAAKRSGKGNCTWTDEEAAFEKAWRKASKETKNAFYPVYKEVLIQAVREHPAMIKTYSLFVDGLCEAGPGLSLEEAALALTNAYAARSGGSDKEVIIQADQEDPSMIKIYFPLLGKKR